MEESDSDIEIVRDWCERCNQYIVLTDVGVFARHRHPSQLQDILLGTWCDGSGERP